MTSLKCQGTYLSDFLDLRITDLLVVDHQNFNLLRIFGFVFVDSNDDFYSTQILFNQNLKKLF